MSQESRVFKLAELAAMVGGEVVGDPEFMVTAARPFDSADLHDITLAAGSKLLAELDRTGSGAIIVPAGTRSSGTKNLLKAGNPKAAFARILQVFNDKAFNCSFST